MECFSLNNNKEERKQRKKDGLGSSGTSEKETAEVNGSAKLFSSVRNH